MKTDDLIDALARDASPPRVSHTGRFVAALGAGLAIALVLTGTFLGFRPDLGVAVMPVMGKSVFSAVAASVSIPVLLRLARPGRPVGWRIGAVIGFVALCAALTAIALMGEDPASRMTAWTSGRFPWCIVTIPLLGAPTAACLVFVLRDLAPTRPDLSGAALGGVAGGVGAIAYAMYCPVDSIAFVTTWYAVAIGFCAAIGAVLGTRLLRW